MARTRTERYRRSWLALAALGTLFLSILLAFHFFTASGSRPLARASTLGASSAQGQEARRETEAKRGDAPAPSQARTLEASRQPPTPLPPHDRGIQVGDPGRFGVTGPTIEEATTPWRARLFRIWRSEPEDQDATTTAATFLASALDKLSIQPMAYHVRCGSSLCRARLRFTELKELHRMEQIERPEGMELVVTLPQRLTDEFVDLSIYWPRKGQSIESVLSREGSP
jgi:hypothetical protein